MKLLASILVLLLTFCPQINAQTKPGKTILRPSTPVKGERPRTVIPRPKGQPTSQNDCCMPMDEKMMQSLFNHVSTGGLNDPYKLDFNNNTNFINVFQAYTDYLKTIYPSLDKMVFHWRLIEIASDTNGNPINAYSPMVSGSPERHNWFVPGGSTTQGSISLFEGNLVPNQWYGIHVGFYTVPETCGGHVRIFYRVQYQGGARLEQFSNGKKIILSRKVSSASK